MGVSWNEFWSMNPRIIRAISESHGEKQREELEKKNFIAYMQGKYFVDGIMCTIGNIGNKGKMRKYPSKPYQIFKPKLLTEAEKQLAVDKFFAEEEARRVNWRRTHKKKDK